MSDRSLVRTEDRSELSASSRQSPTLCATTNSVLGYWPTVSSLTSSYDSALWTVITVLTGPMKSQRLEKVYLLSDFSGFAETQFPTEADAKVAFMDTVGSTQRVASRSNTRCLFFRCATRSKVRTKCHNPFRTLGPLNSSALVWVGIHPTAIRAVARQK